MIAILLAGGRSERVGIDKPTLQLNGEILVERHLRQLRAAGVKDAVIVCHPGNEALIRTRTRVQTVLQRGDSMSSAVFTGMHQTEAHSICAVCVNDIISDDDYRQLFAQNGRDGTILIPTVPLERSFTGGYLELNPETQAVRRIVEKQPAKDEHWREIQSEHRWLDRHHQVQRAQTPSVSHGSVDRQ